MSTIAQELRRIIAGIALSRLTVLAVSLVGLLVICAMENQLATVPFAGAICLSLAAAGYLLSGRPILSVYLGWCILAVATAVSATKYVMKGFSLHFYDLVFVSRDPELLRFLVSEFWHLFIPVLLLVLAAVVFLGFVARQEPRSTFPAIGRAGLAALALALLPATYPAEAGTRYFYYLQGRHASAFFVSFLDLPQFFAEQPLTRQVANAAGGPPLDNTVDCRRPEGQPDIFVILGESQTLPSHFPQLASLASLSSLFHSAGAEPRPLTVETFGGGTWISNLSLLTGLSGTDFGWRSPYLTITLADRVHGALPELLARCGYRTAAILPMEESFVNEGAFLRSIGFETILDRGSIGAPHFVMRDSFYYEAAERFIAEHRATDGRPLLLEIMTMFPHSPYDERIEPELVVEGEPFHEDAEVNEYLRRVAIARHDFGAFMAARRAEPTPRGSVILEFGDHQSFVTKPFVDEIAGPDALADLSSLAYKTFFAIHAFGHALDEDVPDHAYLDIAFLGPHFVRKARLVTSPLMDDLARLKEHCAGRFHACPDRAAIDRHLRRRVDSGLLDIADRHRTGSGPVPAGSETLEQKAVPYRMPGPSIVRAGTCAIPGDGTKKAMQPECHGRDHPACDTAAPVADCAGLPEQGPVARP